MSDDTNWTQSTEDVFIVLWKFHGNNMVEDKVRVNDAIVEDVWSFDGADPPFMKVRTDTEEGTTEYLLYTPTPTTEPEQ